MTRHTVVPLQSYELAHYAVEVPCFVCDGGNVYDAEHCRHCHAPMALRYQAECQPKSPPRMMAVIGPAHGGKTVYLGMLSDVLSRRQQGLQMLLRGAFSVTLQQQVVATLAAGRFPEGTPQEPEAWNWLHGQITRAEQRRPFEVILPDISGDVWEQEVDHAHSSKVLRAFLIKCAGAVLTLDAERLVSGDPTPDFQAMKAASYLSELDQHRKTGWQTRSLAIVFTKSDRAEAAFANPDVFAESHAPGLWRMVRERLPRHRFFATSVVGATAEIVEYGEVYRLPLRIEPRAVTEPLEWLVDQLGG